MKYLQYILILLVFNSCRIKENKPASNNTNFNKYDTINHFDEVINEKDVSHTHNKSMFDTNAFSITIGPRGTWVWISESEFKSHYDSILNLSNVILHICSNSNYDEETFILLSKLENLNFLALRFISETIYSPGLSKLSNVDSIRLYHIKDKYLKDLSKLRQLKYLYFDNPHFKNFPEDYHDFDSLEVLHIELGDIVNITSSINNFENLREINLYKTGVKRLPKEIGDLKKIERITINSMSSSDSLSKDIEELKILLPNAKIEFNCIK